MTPKILSFISSIIAYIILGFTCLMYMNQMIMRPADEVSTIGLSAFAIIAALSGLCFTFLPSLTHSDHKNAINYAGEKFLHSSLLIIQTVFLKYATDALLKWNWLNSITWLYTTINYLSSILLTLIAGSATWFFLYAFEALNDCLWTRYVGRWKKVNKK